MRRLLVVAVALLGTLVVSPGVAGAKAAPPTPFPDFEGYTAFHAPSTGMSCGERHGILITTDSSSGNSKATFNWGRGYTTPSIRYGEGKVMVTSYRYVQDDGTGPVVVAEGSRPGPAGAPSVTCTAGDGFANLYTLELALIKAPALPTQAQIDASYAACTNPSQGCELVRRRG
jgi:hypothetical protein